MKKIILSALVLTATTAWSAPREKTCGNSPIVSQTLSLDSGDSFVRIGNRYLPYELITQEARETHLNPPGKTNLVTVKGCVRKGKDGYTRFLITEIIVKAYQG